MTFNTLGAAIGLGAVTLLSPVAGFAQEETIPSCDPAAFAAKYPSLDGRKVLLGADPSTPPYAMIDPDDHETIIGSDIELASAVFSCMGLEHSVKPGAWPGLFPAVVSGQVDLMFYLYHNATRAEQGDFVTYMRAGSGAIVGEGNPAGITSKADLCGKTLSAGLGTVEERQANKWSEECVADGQDAITVMTSTDVASGFRLVASGRADAMVTDLPLINMMLKRQPDAFDLGYEELTDWQIGAAFANDDPLAPAMFEALKIVQADGTQDEIFAKYGIEPELIISPEFKPE
ncbi:ABC transporter substrate-binding protein [Salipiger sp. PrR007]|uniref:ABC transporter substrate-binding protein n=1 Tax=Salipiger sp. PrR007 TaxID=2706884 RepID=UPI0013BB8272|nr:ABC transporter substrate-binding protein [Salipiger sp. PrR007]NDW33090.1 ABC transporter substrate-binding protein [Salipiger sp. PrR007]